METRLLALFLLFLLLLSLCACGKLGSSTPVNEEPLSDAAQTQNIPEPPMPSLPPPEASNHEALISEPDSPSLKTLRETATTLGCKVSVSYLGCSDGETSEAVLKSIAASGQWEEYPFLLTIPQNRFVFMGGNEIYCIVPTSEEAGLTVQKLGYNEDGDSVFGETVYSGDGHPIILVGNVSDIMPNALVTVDMVDTVQFSPYISLRDGSLAVTGPEDLIQLFGNLTPPPEDEEEDVQVEEPSAPAEPAVPSNGNVIYLTFDDGPSKYTQDLLDVLDKYQVKATFFVVNTGYVDMIGEAYRRGHSIGIHSASHEYSKIYASEEAYFSDLQQMSDIIQEQTGSTTNLLRFPGGSSNTVSSFNPGIMTRLTQSVQDKGYQYFDWNVLSGDAGETTDTDVIVANVINGCTNRTNSVVLQHDSKDYSVAAVERIIQWGLENGYTFLPLSFDSPSAHHHLNN